MTTTNWKSTRACWVRPATHRGATCSSSPTQAARRTWTPARTAGSSGPSMPVMHHRALEQY
ncbi:hypothetical protein DIPPA_01211 [Diplonema papillatum]|nr:hypothetical protein DIPPA_01211 [Diplonema papillatum]